MHAKPRIAATARARIGAREGRRTFAHFLASCSVTPARGHDMDASNLSDPGSPTVELRSRVQPPQPRDETDEGSGESNGKPQGHRGHPGHPERGYPHPHRLQEGRWRDHQPG